MYLIDMNNFQKHNILNYIPEKLTTENEINPLRIYKIKEAKNKTGNIVYIISREFRYYDNFALEYAKEISSKKQKKLKIIFKIPDFSVENKHAFFHKEFEKIKKEFSDNNIDSEIIKNEKEINAYLKKEKPFLVIKDFNPIENNYLETDNFSILEIDGHNIIPTRYISNKQEYNAATFRKKVYLNIAEFLTDFPNKYNEKIITEFIENKLPYYEKFKNNPNQKVTSNFSKFLNWGFISSQRIAIEVFKSNAEIQNKEAFLEELIVRKELADNFCFYCKSYKDLKSIPNWAKESLEQHKKDIRIHLYSIDELENGKTHDELWNAAQRQLLKQGKIEGYLRMYWAKMILQWAATAQEAIDIAVYLNDKYAFDAPSTNGYVGILWSIGALHDRAFKERPILGKIRPMTYNGAKSKFNIQEYIDSV